MLPQGYEKKSFLRLNVEYDEVRLLDEYTSIPEESWANSYWGEIHCAVKVLLLKGGDKGTEQDFFAEQTQINPILEKMQYISHLISDNGPLGRVTYAFLLRMKPFGVALKHVDLIEKWFDLYRVHIPIITNSEAALVSNEKSMHFSSGYAWTFDNQSEHGAVNGPEERVHLVMDVELSQKFMELIDNSTYFEGKVNQENLRRITDNSLIIPSYPGDIIIQAEVSKYRNLGFDDIAISELFNAKGIPTKHSHQESWEEEMVAMLFKDQ